MDSLDELGDLCDLDSTTRSGVILIDDDHLVRDFTMHIIEYGVNRKVVAFDSGFKAWQFVQTCPDAVDVVIADANIPEMDGFELLAHFKRDNPQKPFIITTSNPQYEATACRLGADAFVLKPFDINDLFKVVQQFIIAADSNATDNVAPFPNNERPEIS